MCELAPVKLQKDYRWATEPKEVRPVLVIHPTERLQGSLEDTVFLIKLDHATEGSAGSSKDSTMG